MRRVIPCRLAVLLVGLLIGSAPTMGGAARPQAVSPGSATVASPLAVSCPTFSWGGVADATGYELVVYRVTENGELETQLQVRVPGDARAWTPSASQCPPAGSSYAWAVRAQREEGASAWSEGLMFESASRPTEDDVREALRVLREYSESAVGAPEAGSSMQEFVGADLPVSEGAGRRDPGAAGLGRRRQRPSAVPPADLQALAPPPQTVTPTSFSLKLDADADLGGAIFKGGVPFIHNDGGDTYKNTALGLNALVSATLGSPGPSSGSKNSAFGQNALRYNTSGMRNTAAGYGALAANTQGNGSTAVGYKALAANQSGLNVATGVFALYSNTTGFANTASGYKALYSNTSGTDNTATGYHALQNNLAGGNTAIGSSALASNTSGSSNTAAGGGALAANTIGVKNTAVGSGALNGNVTGNRNTATGFDALRFNTAFANVANGYEALRANTSGSNNTAVGYKAALNNTTGKGNVVIGFSAMQLGTTGDYNTAVGRLAGYGWTTGSNNIALGRGAEGAAGESGVIRIGGFGYQSQTFIEGISGTAVGAGVPVEVTANDQLGVAPSSARFKEDIRDLEDVGEKLRELRPVSFRYKEELVGGSPALLEYGLVAEEVAEVFPELVVLDEEGKPYTVRYRLLTPLLLNELQRQEEELGELREQMADREREHRREIADLERHLDKLAKKKRFRGR